MPIAGVRFYTTIMLALSLSACGSEGSRSQPVSNLGSGAPELPLEQVSSPPTSQSGSQAPAVPAPQDPAAPTEPTEEAPIPPPSAPSVEPRFQPGGTQPLDDHVVAELVNQLNDPPFYFDTAETIDALSHGLVGDGATDNTVVLQRLLAGGNRTIHISEGDYVVGPLNIESNTVLMLEPGVTLRDSGRLGPNQRMLNIRGAENIRIEGHGARVISDRTFYNSGEQRHGVLIFQSQRVLIEGLESSGHGGDGFYVGGRDGIHSTDIYLRGCRADNNRRQGLSITSAQRVYVVDCEFSNTYGTPPAYGIDVEPNHSLDAISRIVLLRPYTHGNAGGDIMLNLHALNASSQPFDVTVIDHATRSTQPNIYVYVAAGATGALMYRSAER